jgi:Zn-dependent M28 family amino/carboxypeptidase
MTQNVVAVWEGSDPRLKSEYVAFGAHYDHVGMSAAPDANGDSIFNGADDDGSGTTALLAVADALRQSPLRPRRSLLFVWHCGEEKGLWGSAYFTSHPTVPLNQIVAQLNIDMIGRSKEPGNQKPADASLSGPREIYVIGSRMMSTQLGNISDRVNNEYQNLKLNFTYDDPKDPNGFFYRSDHINYAQKGIPIIFWFDGVHEDYHKRSDEVSKIDFTKMTLVTQTVFVTAAEIANLPEKIVVDKKLSLPGRD